MTMPNNLVYEQERLDEPHRNGYFIIQDPKRFCFGMDAVLLSGFAKAKKGERVLDLGTGTGIIPILRQRRSPDMKCYVHWMIFCGKPRKCLCREAGFIWCTGRSVSQRS